MLVDDIFIEHLTKLFDAMDRLIRERLILIQALKQAGVRDVDTIVANNIDRPEIRAELDDKLADIHRSKEEMLRLLRGETLNDETPPQNRKPN